MSKRNIIFICIAVAVVIIIAFAVYFIVIGTKNNSTENAEKITLIKYNDNFDVEKTIEITNEKQIKEIKELCNNPSLEQNDTTPYLAIRNDVKLDLENEKFFMIQLDLEEYCYYEDAASSTKLVIKMPEGLLEKVNEILSKNQ